MRLRHFKGSLASEYLLLVMTHHQKKSRDPNRAFNLSSLARLSADVESDAAQLCLELLEDIDNEYHMPILAKDLKF